MKIFNLTWSEVMHLTYFRTRCYSWHQVYIVYVSSFIILIVLEISWKRTDRQIGGHTWGSHKAFLWNTWTWYLINCSSSTLYTTVHQNTPQIWPGQISCTWPIFKLHVTLDLRYNCAKFHYSTPTRSWVIVRTDRRTDRRTDIPDDRIKCTGEHLITTSWPLPIEA